MSDPIEQAFREWMEKYPPTVCFTDQVELCGGDPHNIDKKLAATLHRLILEIGVQIYRAGRADAAKIAREFCACYTKGKCTEYCTPCEILRAIEGR